MFQPPRILEEKEENILRGKCLAGHATAGEIMQLVGHFDLVIMGLREKLDEAGVDIDGE